MKSRVWSACLLAIAVLFRTAVAATPVCHVASAVEAVLGSPDGVCSVGEGIGVELIGVVEGDELALQRALHLAHTNRDGFVAVLFYASWCPFSKLCRPNFNVLASMFPTIQHFSFDESVIRPSIVSKYGVHGFPTIFLLNSTMRVRYHGSRSINSLVAFYNDVTDAKLASLDLISAEKTIGPSAQSELKMDNEPEDCPFSWARSPEKLLQQDAYLALATFFVLIRLVYFLLPNLNTSIIETWRRQILHTSLMSFWNYSVPSLLQAVQALNRLNRGKRRILQEGAINATTRASTSLASVSISETSSPKSSR